MTKHTVPVPDALLSDVIGELQFSAEAHENGGDEFCLSRAHEIRSLAWKLLHLRERISSLATNERREERQKRKTEQTP